MIVKAFGLNFKGVNIDNVLALGDRLKFIVTVNAEFIVDAHSDQKFKSIINNNWATFDGQIPFFLAKLRNRNVNIDKVSGSDLIYLVLARAAVSGHKVFLLGDSASINAKAVNVAVEGYGAICDGFSPPFEGFPFSDRTERAIRGSIELARPTYLFVAFGAKKQEFWINENKEFLENVGVKWVVGCGGSIRFLSGEVKRAPRFIQRVGLESLYRLTQEPKLFRLARILKSFRIVRYIF